MERVCASALSRRVASQPFITGISRSIRIRSGAWIRAWAMASCPFVPVCQSNHGAAFLTDARRRSDRQMHMQIGIPLALAGCARPRTGPRARTDRFRPLLDELFTPMRGWGGRLGEMLRVPDADVVETESEIRVTLDLPGMRPEDVSVDLENNVLTISGERMEERTEGEENNTWHLSERRYGKFSRSFVLPREVEQEKIEARFEDGVLNVTVPKSEQAKRRRIEIQNGGGQKRVEASTGGSK
jgi:HSP20 family protein